MIDIEAGNKSWLFRYLAILSLLCIFYVCMHAQLFK